MVEAVTETATGPARMATVLLPRLESLQVPASAPRGHGMRVRGLAVLLPVEAQVVAMKVEMVQPRNRSNADVERRQPCSSPHRKLLENKGSFGYSLRLPERPLQKGCLK
jgi:hypothetical protein